MNTGPMSRFLRPLLLLFAAMTLVLVVLKATGLWFTPTTPSPREIAQEFLAAGHTASEERAGTARGPLFTDIAQSAGIRFMHDSAMRGEFLLPEEMGPGGAFLDFNNNGLLDVFIAGGGAIVDDGPVQTCRLYRNDGGNFTDVTDRSGAGVPGPAYGVACADYNNNGFVDIFITRLGPDVLLRNNGDGTFADVTHEAGIDEPRFSASAAFFDYEVNGLLDLYITVYVDWSPGRERACYSILGLRDYCNPKVYDAPTNDRLYRNLGGGRFEDVTEQAGISAKRGNGLGVVAADFNGNGLPDLYVANDQTPAFFWRNNGDGTLSEVAANLGCAYDGRGVAIAGMGVACEDLTGDGRFDLLVTNIADQTNIVFRNEGDWFTDISLPIGMAPWSIPATGFGVALFDQNNDGELDGFIANGAVNAAVQTSHRENLLAEPDHFVRMIDGRFVDFSDVSGAAFNDVGRGLAWGDIDNDGNIDLLVLNNGGPARLLRNNNDSGNSWLIVDARTLECRRAAIGARVEVTADGRTWRREVRPHSSYLSSSDPRVHFGLGNAKRVEHLSIIWPDGSVTERADVVVNQVLRVDQVDEGSTKGSSSP